MTTAVYLVNLSSIRSSNQLWRIFHLKGIHWKDVLQVFLIGDGANSIGAHLSCAQYFSDFYCSKYLYRVVSRSREPVRTAFKNEEVEEHLMHERSQKAIAAQWLCFNPPPGLENSELLRVELLARAVQHRFPTKHLFLCLLWLLIATVLRLYWSLIADYIPFSNILLSEFALTSLQRNIRMPVAAHMLLGYLVEPLNQPVEYSLCSQHHLKENIDEIQEWVMLIIDDVYLIPM